MIKSAPEKGSRDLPARAAVDELLGDVWLKMEQAGYGRAETAAAIIAASIAEIVAAAKKKAAFDPADTASAVLVATYDEVSHQTTSKLAKDVLIRCIRALELSDKRM